jgi:hypothetical protein
MSIFSFFRNLLSKRSPAALEKLRELPNLGTDEPASSHQPLPHPWEPTDILVLPPRGAQERDGYASFVDECWAMEGVRTPPIELLRNGLSCTLFSVIPMGQGHYPYLNVIENGMRATYAGDGRHKWERDGAAIDCSAFSAVLAGADAEAVLCPDAPPTSLEEAIVKNRADAKGHVYFLHYRTFGGEESWRVISGVRRRKDEFDAFCHFRWGTRRTFRFERVLEILDGETGELIDMDTFIQGPKSHKKATK